METPVTFLNGGEVLRGVIHAPDTDRPRRGAVVFLHGWSGCRLGPHRMFVTAARRLTATGFVCLRFDFRGRGDSDGQTAGATIRGMIRDTACAMDFARKEAGAGSLVLLGICSGGKVALGAAAECKGVGALVLWSAEAMGRLKGAAPGRSKSRHALGEYARKLMRPETWRKIASRGVNLRMVRRAVLSAERARDDEVADENRMIERLAKYRGDVLFVFGGNDPETVVAAGNYERFCAHHGIPARFHEVRDANHSFYSLAWEREVLDLTVGWLSAWSERTC